MSTDSDHRRLKRHLILDPVEVYDQNRDVHLGRLVNIHREGLMVLGESPLDTDKLYQLELQLSWPVQDDHTAIFLAVDCLWARPADIEGKYWSGFQIIDVSDEQMKLVHALVDELAQDD